MLVLRKLRNLDIGGREAEGAILSSKRLVREAPIFSRSVCQVVSILMGEGGRVSHWCS